MFCKVSTKSLAIRRNLLLAVFALILLYTLRRLTAASWHGSYVIQRVRPDDYDDSVEFPFQMS